MTLSWFERRDAWVAVVAGGLAIQLAFMIYLQDRAYPDVFRAVRHGQQLADPTADPGLINSKTSVSPRVWFAVYDAFGLAGLRIVNLGLLLALVAVHARLGLRLFDKATTTVATWLLVFYPGTHRNVAAGEQDDMLAAVATAAAVLIHLGGGARFAVARALTAGLIMGIGFLFKYWTALFFAGLALYLATRRQGRLLAAAIVGMALPFVLLNLIDGAESLQSLWLSLNIQMGYSRWSQIAVKVVNTGLLPCLALAVCAWWRDQSAARTLCLLVPLPYVLYVFVARDSFAMSFVMMVCVTFWGFLVARALVELMPPSFRQTNVALVLLLVFYILGTTAITYRNLWNDTLTAASVGITP